MESQVYIIVFAGAPFKSVKFVSQLRYHRLLQDRAITYPALLWLRHSTRTQSLVRLVHHRDLSRRNHISARVLLLTPWCRVLLEKLTGLQLVKKFPALQGTRRFITALTSIRQLSLSWTSPIQSIYPHPTSWRSILILRTHLRLGLPCGLLPSGFPSKTLYTPCPHPYAVKMSTYLK